ncbi:hypothetical protein BJX61DRAFT_489803 [Aspergillus egyptiacus]|nr:hypothetical protein BJX61DRAFT_489803 [Aspergillus egyptiacus]
MAHSESIRMYPVGFSNYAQMNQCVVDMQKIRTRPGLVTLYLSVSTCGGASCYLFCFN